ncbi:MAG: acetyl-CoA carboxylase, carboxyltransferase subunit beta [Treponema sp.]|jgi:acetyl-CoA carboxylase carboxyl transferase subunit beta|nr:acetyl-CoA carboxylase, carboxyltransferase subunit beta [Treponema sp.]
MADFICPRCQAQTGMEDFVKNYRVCPSCTYHARLCWRERLDLTADPDSFVEFCQTMDSENPISYPGYREKIAELQRARGTREAAVTGRCTIMGCPAVIGIMDSHFMMASMGSVVGEKITRAFEYGTEHHLPVIIFTASGGARMQEGIFSLMQMAKTSGAAARHYQAGELYITVLADPTTGGVTASFASLGNIIIAEPGVLIGFAGKRVIQDTIGQALPEKFQTAEFVYEHGFADMIVHRDSLRDTLSRLIRLHGYAEGNPDRTRPEDKPMEFLSRPAAGKTAKSKLSVTRRLELLHSLDRPSVTDYIPHIFASFIELHGDRYFGDDPAVMAGIAFLGDTPVTLISQVRGRNIEELKRTNFSMPHPEGYRKALRLAKEAEKFHRPVICLIDTPGAFCGFGAEERGQGESIARNLMEFMTLKTPVISVILGEGGSGGALALGVCDELAMLENALYSVISPRGFASILWKDASREKEAAELMKISAEDLLAWGICEKIIDEPAGNAAMDIPLTAKNLAGYLFGAVKRHAGADIDALLEKRYQKYRRIGVFSE